MGGVPLLAKNLFIPTHQENFHLEDSNSNQSFIPTYKDSFFPTHAITKQKRHF